MAALEQGEALAGETRIENGHGRLGHLLGIHDDHARGLELVAVAPQEPGAHCGRAHGVEADAPFGKIGGGAADQSGDGVFRHGIAQVHRQRAERGHRTGYQRVPAAGRFQQRHRGPQAEHRTVLVDSDDAEIVLVAHPGDVVQPHHDSGVEVNKVEVSWVVGQLPGERGPF